jgi:two-component system, NarL family, response regulator
VKAYQRDKWLEAIGDLMKSKNVLTKREREVLDEIRRGKRNWQIAKELSISENTVETHNKHIFRKLGVRNRTQAAIYHNRGDF